MFYLRGPGGVCMASNLALVESVGFKEITEEEYQGYDAPVPANGVDAALDAIAADSALTGGSVPDGEDAPDDAPEDDNSADDSASNDDDED